MAEEKRDYSIIGRVIDRDRAPVAGLRVRALEHGGRGAAPSPLGETETDMGGRFELTIERGHLKRTGGKLRRAPRVSVDLHDRSDRLVYATRAAPIDWQLEFRVYLGASSEETDAPNLYAGSMKRMMTGTKESGVTKNAMGSMGGPAPQEGEEKRGAWESVSGMLQDYSALEDMMNMGFGAFDGVMTDARESTRLRSIGYDGAQVPRDAWKTEDHQAIIWPRKEPFRWA